MATFPHLPIELHAEIRNNLHHYRDRRTLIAASLVNKEWSTGSQRILFRKVTDDWYQSPDSKVQDRVISTHMGFLQTIIDHPRRLGTLVHSYAQDSASFYLPPISFKRRADLWKLTERALPTMINLKHLYFNPFTDSLPVQDNWASLSALFNSFTFQLETFVWKCHYSPHHGLLEFLRSQNNLLHFETIVDKGDLLWLDNSVCHQLVSGSGTFDSLTHIARSRKIIAWHLYSSQIKANLDIQVLDALRYLSIDKFGPFCETIGRHRLNIIMLELDEGSWDLDTFASLPHMPQLRVLALVQRLYSPYSMEVVVQVAVDCFRRFSSLEYIIQRNYLENGHGYRCWKLSLSPNLSEGILRDELAIDYDVGTVWWTVYNV